MCGIAGFFGQEFGPGEGEAILRSMLAFIRHRGPDEFGYLTDGAGGLAVARLRVIDLLSGQQPLSDRSGRYSIAYNGEAYNYRELREDLRREGSVFETSSDTEVVLQSWIRFGPAGFSRINGGFALAIYDRFDQRLTLARDRFGKRPLFYRECGPGIAFGSEIKALLGMPGPRLEFDPARVLSILSLWTPLPDQTCFLGVHQLPSASWLVADAHGVSTGRYAEPFEAGDVVPADAEAMRARTRTLVSQSVHRRLVADVEVGVYLSGGLDSAIVAAEMATQTGRPVKSFSVAFSEEAYSEASEQREAAALLGLEASTLTITPADIASAFPAALWHAETPVFRTAFVPMFLLSRFVRERGVSVVMSGEGADEAFLGYEIFKETLVLGRWDALGTEAVKRDILSRLYPYLSHFQGDSTRAMAGHFAHNRHGQGDVFASHRLRFSNSGLALRLLGRASGDLKTLSSFLSREVAGFADMDPLRRAQCLEHLTLLQGYLLSTQGDRMSFAHGVETRCPFLDPDLVRFAMSLPTRVLLDDDLAEKRLLREAFAGRLPASILSRQKRPYRAPNYRAFVEGGDIDYLDSISSKSELARIPFLDVSFASRFVEKMRKTPPESVSPREEQTFLQLLSLRLLHDFFIEPRSSPPAPVPDHLIMIRVVLPRPEGERRDR